MQAAVAPRLCTVAAGPVGRRQPLMAGRHPWAAAPNRRHAGLALLAAAEGQASRVRPPPGLPPPVATLAAPSSEAGNLRAQSRASSLKAPCSCRRRCRQCPVQKDRHRMVADTESEEEYDAESDIPMSQARYFGRRWQRTFHFRAWQVLAGALASNGWPWTTKQWLSHRPVDGRLLRQRRAQGGPPRPSQDVNTRPCCRSASPRATRSERWRTCRQSTRRVGGGSCRGNWKAAAPVHAPVEGASPPPSAEPHAAGQVQTLSVSTY